MDKTADKQVNTRIPTQLTEEEFNEFFLPHLSMPKRGPKCKIGYHRLFNCNRSDPPKIFFTKLTLCGILVLLSLINCW